MSLSYAVIVYTAVACNVLSVNDGLSDGLANAPRNYALRHLGRSIEVAGVLQDSGAVRDNIAVGRGCRNLCRKLVGVALRLDILENGSAVRHDVPVRGGCRDFGGNIVGIRTLGLDVLQDCSTVRNDIAVGGGGGDLGRKVVGLSALE